MSQHTYIENQKILCYHGDFLYEAKVLRVDGSTSKEVDDDLHSSVNYFIHYNGWNKTWDECVPSSRLLPLTQDNLLKQKQLFKDYERRNQISEKVKLKKKKLHASTLQDLDSDVRQVSSQSLPTPIQSKSKTNNDLSIGTIGCCKSTISNMDESHSRINNFSYEKQLKRAAKHGRNLTEDNCSVSSSKKARKLRYITVSEEIYANQCSLTISIPTELKLWLIDDHELINRQRYLISIPKRISVVDILALYTEYRIEKYPHRPSEEAIALFCLGIREYFDISLGMELLYKFERPQYVQLLSDYPKISMSEIYGVEHLLRLFVRLSDLLSFTKLDGSSIEILEASISEFLCFLEMNLNSFHGDYIPVTQEYVRRMSYS